MSDRFDKGDAEFREKRRARRLAIEAEAKAAETRALLDANKDRVDAAVMGTPLPLPEVGKAGPPPVGMFAPPHKYTKGPGPVPKPTEYVAADVLGGLTMLPNGDAVLAECRGIKISASGNGLLVSSPNLSKDDWFPVAGIHDDSDVYEPGTDGNLIVDAWVARKRGWV